MINIKILGRKCFGSMPAKECKGNAGFDIKCSFYEKCIAETNYLQGVCDCKFKKSCHIGRQRLQEKIRGNNNYNYNKIEDCSFYKSLEALTGKNVEPKKV